jgi:hypothetical protein
LEDCEVSKAAGWWWVGMRDVRRAAEECRCRRDVVWASRAEFKITEGGL